MDNAFSHSLSLLKNVFIETSKNSTVVTVVEMIDWYGMTRKQAL